MKVLLQRFISFILVFAGSLTSTAQGTEQTGVIHVFFGNGMFNSAADANASLYELQSLDLSLLDPTLRSRIEYDLALNLNESDLDNILSVIAQHINGDLSFFWNVMDAVVPMPDWLVAPITRSLEAYRDVTTLDGDTLNRMLTQYQDAYQKQEPILLVSHSQGNFYAEEALNRLLFQNHLRAPSELHFANVRVAPPLLSRFSFPYFTFGDDEILKWVSAFLNSPAPNLLTSGSGPGPYEDPRGHDFVLAYLHHAESREKITSAILSALQGFKNVLPLTNP